MEDGEELLPCSNNLISRGCGLHLEADEQLLTGLLVDTPAFDSRSMLIQNEPLSSSSSSEKTSCHAYFSSVLEQRIESINLI